MVEISTYRVVVRGPLAGFTPQQAADGLATLFRITPEMAMQLISSAQPVPIRKGVALQQAARYEAAIGKCGVGCVIEPETDLSLRIDCDETGQSASGPVVKPSPQMTAERPAIVARPRLTNTAGAVIGLAIAVTGIVAGQVIA